MGSFFSRLWIPHYIDRSGQLEPCKSEEIDISKLKDIKRQVRAKKREFTGHIWPIHGILTIGTWSTARRPESSGRTYLKERESRSTAWCALKRSGREG